MLRFGITERGDAAFHATRLLHNAPFYDGCVWITKAPQAFTGVQLPGNVILHCTITGFGGTAVEPGVRPAAETLAIYDKLIDVYGGERIVLRVDPIIPTARGLETARTVIARRRGRVRVSYLDLYPHVQQRFAAAGIQLPWTTFHAPDRQHDLGSDVEICGEPGLPCTGCVSERDFRAIGLPVPDADSNLKGQRPACRCLASKTELLAVRGQCPHGCLYCYWK